LISSGVTSRAAVRTALRYVAVAGVIGAALILTGCGGGSGSPSASKSTTSSQTRSQSNATALAGFAKSVTTDEHDTIGPQVQAITAAVTAGYQALDNGISSAGALEQQNLQQSTQQMSPSSPQFQQENQCVDAAGPNPSAIDQCLQTAEQPFTSNEQAQSNAEAQAVQESDGDVKTAANAFSTLSTVFLWEGQKLQDFGLTGRDSQLADTSFSTMGSLALTARWVRLLRPLAPPVPPSTRCPLTLSNWLATTTPSSPQSDSRST